MNSEQQIGQSIEITPSPFVAEAKQRLAKLEEWGLIPTVQVIQNECDRLELVQEVRHITDTQFADIHTYPTANEITRTRTTSTADLLFRNVYGVELDFSKVSVEQADRLTAWLEACQGTLLYKKTINSSMPTDYSSKGSLENAAISLMCDEMDQMAQLTNESTMIALLKNLFSILQKIEVDGVILYYTAESFGMICKKIRTNGWHTAKELIEQHDRSLLYTCRDSRWNVGVHDVEGNWTILMDLSELEKETIRRENWAKLDTWMQERSSIKSEITLDDLVTIHQVATKSILPSHMAGLRNENVSIEKHDAPSALEMQKDLSVLLTRANKLTHATHLSDLVWMYELSSVALEYARIHPHVDGNGTAGLFFCELVARLKGVPAANIVELDFQKRVRAIFRESPLALINLAVGEHVLTKKEPILNAAIKILRGDKWRELLATKNPILAQTVIHIVDRVMPKGK